MLQLEREQSGQKIAEYKSYIEILNNINYQNLNTVVSIGALVYTTHLNFYLAIPIGEIIVKNHCFYGISLRSPKVCMKRNHLVMKLALEIKHLQF